LQAEVSYLFFFSFLFVNSAGTIKDRHNFQTFVLFLFCGKVTLLNFVRYIFKYRFSFGKHQIDFNSPWKGKLHCIETAVKFAFYVGNVLLAIFINCNWRETGPKKRIWLKSDVFGSRQSVKVKFCFANIFFDCQESRNETLSLELNFFLSLRLWNSGTYLYNWMLCPI